MMFSRVIQCCDYLSAPALVAWLAVESLTHHIRAFLIVIGTAETVGLAWWHCGNTIERLVPFKSVLNVLLGCGTDGFRVGAFQSRNGSVFRVAVARERSGVVGTFVMVRASAYGRVETVNRVRALHGTLLKMV